MEIKKEWVFSDSVFAKFTDKEYNESLLLKDDTYVDLIVSKYKDLNFKKINASKYFEYLEDTNKLMENYTLIYRYYSFQNSLNTQDQEINKYLSYLSSRWVENGQKLAFLSDKIKDIGYDKLIKFSEMPKFKKIKNYVVSSASNIKYILDSKEEAIINLIGNINNYTTDDLYTELSNSFTFSFNGVDLNESALMTKTKSPDEHTRKTAFNLILNKYKSHAITFSSIYKSVCKSNAVFTKKRNYDNVMSSRNISEDLGDATVNNLLKNVKSSFYPMYSEFLKIKASLIGKDKLNFYDVYAKLNLTDSESQKIEFEDGLNMFLKTIKKFDTNMYNYSLDMFNKGRVSVYPNKGKRGGAYCVYDKDLPSYVLLNYEGTIDDVMTLAHEFGHAIHGDLMQQNHDFVYDAPLCLAETASIFTETLMYSEMYTKIKDDKVKIQMLVDELDDLFSTIVRQIMYTSFEYRCHNSFYNGEELSLDDFNAIWLEELNEMYGGAVALDDLAGYGWCRIPHIYHTPFYCYTYAFGNILSLNLIKMYKDSDKKSEFKKIYKKILSSGSSKKPDELLSECGFDLNSMEYYKNASEYVSNLIEEVKILIDFELN